MGKREFLDFAKIKSEANVIAVLKKIGLFDTLTDKGNGEYAGWCQLTGEEHGKADSFNINVEDEGQFQCFACKRKGSILDLAHYVTGDDLRSSAQLVRDITQDALDDRVMDVVGEEIEPPKVNNENDLEKMLDGIVEDENYDLIAVMSFEEAVRRVRNGACDMEDLRVVDLSTLKFVDSVVKAQAARV